MILLLPAAIVLLSDPLPSPLWSLAAVIVGGLIATVTQILVSRSDQTQRKQLALLDRRIAAHQSAYHLATQLVSWATSREPSGLPDQLKNWFEQHSLLLAPDLRRQFEKAIRCANSHGEYLRVHADSSLLERNFKEITDLPEAIEAAFSELSQGG